MTAKKRFGQHFLTNKNYIAKIVDGVLNYKNNLVEIGPGQGAITLPIVKQRPLTVIEIDRDLLANLDAISRDYSLQIINSDILKVDFSDFPAPMCVFGNLPYNISTPILFHLLKYIPNIDCMIFMLQKEVVDRMQAKVGTHEYGRLSVMLQKACYIEKLFDVPQEAFSPPPKVMSSVVKMVPLHTESPFEDILDMAIFSDVVRHAFNQRRKTIRNSLQKFLTANDFTNLEIDAKLRAQNLSVADYIRISNYIALPNKVN